MDGTDCIMTQAIGVIWVVGVMDKLLGFAVKLIESTTLSPNPKQTKTVFSNGSNGIIAQAIRLVRLVSIVDKLFGFLVKAIESATLSPNPEHTETVFIDR